MTPPRTAGPLHPDYVTIAPSVSVSRTSAPGALKQAKLDPHADVMAEILAIPPGR